MKENYYATNDDSSINQQNIKVTNEYQEPSLPANSLAIKVKLKSNKVSYRPPDSPDYQDNEVFKSSQTKIQASAISGFRGSESSKSTYYRNLYNTSDTAENHRIS